MEYLIELKLWVDPEANFLDTDPKYADQSVKELLQDIIYDIDDVKATSIKVEEK